MLQTAGRAQCRCMELELASVMHRVVGLVLHLFALENKQAKKTIKPELYLMGRELLQRSVFQLSVKINSYTSSLGP